MATRWFAVVTPAAASVWPRTVLGGSRPLAQDVLLHLAGRGHRQVAEHDVARAFEAGEVGAAVGDDVPPAVAVAPGFNITKAQYQKRNRIFTKVLFNLLGLCE